MAKPCRHPAHRVIGPPPGKTGRRLCLECGRCPDLPPPVKDR